MLPLAEVTVKTYTYSQTFEGWPAWLVTALLVVVALAVLWVLWKIFEAVLWVAFWFAVIGGLAWLVWALMGQGP